MKKIYFIFIALLTCTTGISTAENTSSELSVSHRVTFTPPEGWKAAAADQLSSRVKIMLVGNSSKGFTPSINLATEQYDGTLAQYLKIVKSINDSKGNTWKNLGNITTEAGVGNLSQVESKSQWGTLKMMHVILLKDGVMYILTATALADEFSSHYNNFFASFRSLKINYEDALSSAVQVQ